MTTGQHLRKLRTFFKVKQKDIAQRCSVDQMKVKEWENEEGEVAPEVLNNYVNATGIDFDECMALLDKYAGENTQEIRPRITRARSGGYVPPTEQTEGVVIAYPDPHVKFSFMVGSSLQITDGEWIRANVGIDWPCSVATFEDTVQATILKARTILREEMGKMFLAAAEDAHIKIKDKENGDFSGVSKSTDRSPEETSGENKNRQGTQAHSQGADWDFTT